jgi:hypothetical protein
MRGIFQILKFTTKLDIADKLERIKANERNFKNGILSRKKFQ